MKFTSEKFNLIYRENFLENSIKYGLWSIFVGIFVFQMSLNLMILSIIKMVAFLNFIHFYDIYNFSNKHSILLELDFNL